MKLLEQFGAMQVVTLMHSILRSPVIAEDLKSELIAIANEIYKIFGFTPAPEAQVRATISTLQQK